ncbi:MAG: hypothetical protein IJ696_08315 [Ruminococcus sp.]|nr:hypothetical protein [Ruminococcus sp.]
MDNETVELIIKFAVKAVVIMAAIGLMAVITPKLARLIEKRHPGINDQKEPEDDGVKGVYDKQSSKYDLNYKIYNTDIYGVDFKHGKKRKQDGE